MSVDAVAATLHAGSESPVVVVPLLGELCIVLLLCDRLLSLLIGAPHCPAESADCGPGRGSPAGISGNGATDSAERGAPGSTAEGAALWRR